MPTSFDFSASVVELLRLRTNPRTRANTRMNELGLSESESLSGRKNIGTIVEERVPDSLWFCSLLIDWCVGGWWFMMIHACWVVHVEFIQSLMRRVALIFWSISSRWIRSSGIPRPEDLKRFEALRFTDETWKQIRSNSRIILYRGSSVMLVQGIWSTFGLPEWDKQSEHS